jgi:hypothetical protein
VAPAVATSPSKPEATPIAKGPSVNHPLWLQAEAAERDGRNDDAEKLYFQLARVMNEPGGDHDIANLCYTRIHALREKKRTSSLPSASPAASTPVGTTVKTDTPKSDRPMLGPPSKQESPTWTSTQPKPETRGGDRGAWTGTGRLVLSPLGIEGKQTYALETAPGVTQLYVIASSGVNIEQFKKKNVKVFGTTHTHPNVSKPYVLATEIVEANQ